MGNNLVFFGAMRRRIFLESYKSPKSLNKMIHNETQWKFWAKLLKMRAKNGRFFLPILSKLAHNYPPPLYMYVLRELQKKRSFLELRYLSPKKRRGPELQGGLLPHLLGFAGEPLWHGTRGRSARWKERGIRSALLPKVNHRFSDQFVNSIAEKGWQKLPTFDRHFRSGCGGWKCWRGENKIPAEQQPLCVLFAGTKKPSFIY